MAKKVIAKIVEVVLHGVQLHESLFNKKQMALVGELVSCVAERYNSTVTSKETAAQLVEQVWPIGVTDPSGADWQEFVRGIGERCADLGVPSEYAKRTVREAYVQSRATVDDDGVVTLGMLPTKGVTSGNGKGNAGKGKSPKRGASSLVTQATKLVTYIAGLATLDINPAKFEACVTAGEAMLAAAEAMNADIREADEA